MNTKIRNSSEEDVRKLFKDYSVKAAINLGLVDIKKYSEYKNVDLDLTKNKLLHLFNQQGERIKEIESALFKNAALELFIELSSVYKDFYIEHFHKYESAYRANLAKHIFQVMLINRSADEHDFLNYTEQDIANNPDGTKKVNDFWTFRNYYIAIKNCWASLASEIFNRADEEYSSYFHDMLLINCANGNYDITFGRLKTEYAKLQLIEFFWKLVKVNEGSIDYSNLLNNSDVLEKILIHCLQENNKFLYDNIRLLFYAMFSVKNYDREVNRVKNEYVKILKRFMKSQKV